MELHPAHSAFSAKRGLKSPSNVFSESLIPPVCNVTPHEHKDEMSEHFCFCTGHTIQTPAAKLDSMAPIQHVWWFLAVYF